MPAVLALALLAGFAAAASGAAPVEVTPHQEETVAPYVARVYFDAKAKDGTDSYFEILKDGKPVYMQKARKKGEKFFIGTMYKDDPDAAMVKMGMDITGAGQPDLVISEWLGGANCCLLFHVFEIGPTFKKIGTIDAAFGDSGPHFLHPDKDSKSTGLAIEIHDWNFANWHTDFADSPAPKGHPALQRQCVPNGARPDARCADAYLQRPCRSRCCGQELCAQRQGRYVASR